MLCLCVLANFVLCRSHLPNADYVQNLNELPAIWRGNILLDHWALAADNFYFTDLSFFVLLSSIFGMKLWLFYVQPVIIYALLTLAAILLVARARPTDAGVGYGATSIIYLIGLPFVPGLLFLLSPAIHIGTIMVSLYALICVQPALSGSKFHRLWLLPFFLLGFAATASDPLAQVILTCPLLSLIVLRCWLYRRFDGNEWIIFVVMCTAGAAGMFWPHYTAHNHGFNSQHTFDTNFVTGLADLVSDIHALGCALVNFFTANSTALIANRFYYVLSITRMLVLVVVLLLCLRVIWMAPRARTNGIGQCLVLAALCLAIMNVISTPFQIAITSGPGYPNAAMRYVTPIYFYLCIAAVIELQAISVLTRSFALRGAVQMSGIAFAVLFFMGAIPYVNKAARMPAGVAAVPEIDLAKWLEDHNLTYGVGDYWTLQLMTFESHQTVSGNPMLPSNGRLVPFRWLSDQRPLLAGKVPQFAVLNPRNPWKMSLAEITQTYGKPMAVYNVSGFIVALLMPAAR
jgi:hypothetical protein